LLKAHQAAKSFVAVVADITFIVLFRRLGLSLAESGA